MAENRREFLRKSALLGLVGLAGNFASRERLEILESQTMVLSGGGEAVWPELPYAYDALEPFIDKKTMEIHHTKHHKGYVEKLNSAPASEIDLGLDIAENCRKVTEKTSALIRNNLGGHYNHSMFWQMMKPNKTKKIPLPEGALAEAINKEFKSFDGFKTEFSEKASKIFGSGWCWLILDKGKLKITTTPNQDNPLMKVAAERGTPVLGLDVWEHAYYLKYQNKRVDYISNWWNVVNWEKAAALYASAK
jgi:superoxide dismutase, Fe-Mn family